MTEHDAERTGGDEGREPLPTEGPAAAPASAAPESSALETPVPAAETALPAAETVVPAGEPEAAAPEAAAPETPAAPAEPLPLDEDAAWAAIVAGYGDEPPDPPGAKPFKPIEDLYLPDENQINVIEPDRDDADAAGRNADKAALGSSVVFAPGVGPRDYTLDEPETDEAVAGKAKGGAKAKGASGADEDDEGHFVPPEPPPLPEADATAKFAWLGVVGGPVLMLLTVLLGWEMTWWLTTVCIGGFLGGFATLVARMPHDDDDEEMGDPGRGAVV
ncbi:hypothetical protein [uncultured Streptomyces sp.]|uniref:hypothetical protein n=1 Tax=uncultured Streptomyces sp. TaxID=174707 RepID=UPI00262F9803|nr:hypothetical protein [uncultured Streptomyces sp.]